MKNLQRLNSLPYLTILGRIADSIAPKIADTTCRFIDAIVDTFSEKASEINPKN